MQGTPVTRKEVCFNCLVQPNPVSKHTCFFVTGVVGYDIPLPDFVVGKDYVNGLS